PVFASGERALRDVPEQLQDLVAFHPASMCSMSAARASATLRTTQTTTPTARKAAWQARCSLVVVARPVLHSSATMRPRGATTARRSGPPRIGQPYGTANARPLSLTYRASPDAFAPRTTPGSEPHAARMSCTSAE